jgi:hypothetical protein
MNKFSSMYWQILQIFSKRGFLEAIRERKAEGMTTGSLAGTNSLSCCLVRTMYLSKSLEPIRRLDKESYDFWRQ